MYLYILLFSAACVVCSFSPLVDPFERITLDARQLPVSGNGTNSTLVGPSNTPLVRGLATSIAGAIAIWTGVTYTFIISRSPSLAQGLALPLRSLERSLSSILAEAWVAKLLSPLERERMGCLQVLRLEERKCPEQVSDLPDNASLNQPNDIPNPIQETAGLAEEYSNRRDSNLPVRGSDDTEEGSEPAFFGRGHEEVDRCSVTREDQQLYQRTKGGHQIWLNPASSVIKNIIILGIWEFWSFWMVLAMVALTVVYNGFIYQQRGPDAVLRLVLICIYATINFAHMGVTWIYLWRILDSVGNQVCWVIIARLFVFFSPENHRKSRQCVNDSDHGCLWDPEIPLYLRSFQCELLGPIKTMKLCRSANTSLTVDKLGGGSDSSQDVSVNWEGTYSDPKIFLKDWQGPKVTAEDDLKPLIELEIKALEKAAESGLEKQLANVIILLGICLSTGLAPWTTIQSRDSTATQIGSYAIILSISTGSAALIASLSYLSNAATSAETLRRLQYHILSLSKEEYETNLSARTARYGSRACEVAKVTYLFELGDLFDSTSPRLKLLWLLWGPFLGLLSKPRKNQYSENQRRGWNSVLDIEAAQPLQDSTTTDEESDQHTDQYSDDNAMRFTIPNSSHTADNPVPGDANPLSPAHVVPVLTTAHSLFQFDTSKYKLHKADMDEVDDHVARVRVKQQSQSIAAGQGQRQSSNVPEQASIFAEDRIPCGENDGESIPLHNQTPVVGSSGRLGNGATETAPGETPGPEASVSRVAPTYRRRISKMCRMSIGSRGLLLCRRHNPTLHMARRVPG